MFMGTLIDDLIATVERAETSFRPEGEPQAESRGGFWYTIDPNQLAKLDSGLHLVGVA
jgi:hypothetical protein